MKRLSLVIPLIWQALACVGAGLAVPSLAHAAGFTAICDPTSLSNCATVNGSGQLNTATTITGATITGPLGSNAQASSVSVALDTTTTGYLQTIATNSGLQLPSTSKCQTSALASNLVCKASAGTLYEFNVVADSTLDAAAWYVMIFDATSLPANGAVTPAKCYAVPSGTATWGGTFQAGGEGFSTGIVVGVSTTGCFSLTASTHAFISGGYN